MLNPVYNLRTYTRVKIHEFNYLKTRWNCPKCTQGYIWIWRQLHTCIHAGIKALCNKVQNSKNLNIHSIQHPLYYEKFLRVITHRYGEALYTDRNFLEVA